MPSDAMNAIFADFAKLLESRLREQVLTTEDSVRYTLFASLLNHNVELNSLILEYPHPEIPRAQIDTWISEYYENSIAIEFKYDREKPGGKNQPKTQKAGSVFQDLFRLQLANKNAMAVCYFIYLTDAEMHVYFKNPKNGHKELYELPQHSIFRMDKNYFSGKPKTFMSKLKEPFEASITSILKRSLIGEHHLRIYRVEAA